MTNSPGRMVEQTFKQHHTNAICACYFFVNHASLRFRSMDTVDTTRLGTS